MMYITEYDWRVMIDSRDSAEQCWHDDAAMTGTVGTFHLVSPSSFVADRTPLLYFGMYCHDQDAADKPYNPSVRLSLSPGRP
jgi:hypothetical protein